MTSKFPDVESHVDLDALDNETRYVISDEIASMHDDVMNGLSDLRRSSRIDRWISIVGTVAAVIAAVAALFSLLR